MGLRWNQHFLGAAFWVRLDRWDPVTRVTRRDHSFRRTILAARPSLGFTVSVGYTLTRQSPETYIMSY
jgi:hypothetical protein